MNHRAYGVLLLHFVRFKGYHYFKNLLLKKRTLLLFLWSFITALKKVSNYSSSRFDFCNNSTDTTLDWFELVVHFRC